MKISIKNKNIAEKARKGPNRLFKGHKKSQTFLWFFCSFVIKKTIKLQECH